MRVISLQRQVSDDRSQGSLVFAAAEASQRTVLPVGLEIQTQSLVRRVLAPIRVVNEEEGGVGALRLTSRMRVDGLVVSFPLSDVAIETFLKTVRGSDSPCRQAGLILVAAEGFRMHAQEHVNRGANRFVSLGEIEHGLRPAVEKVLGAAPRLPAQVPARLEILAPGFARRVFCQTVNISLSGMLLRAHHSYPAGTELGFELLLPNRTKPVRGRAQVVRASVQRREPYPGIGVAFAGFDLDGALRLAEFLRTTSL